ncbi:hypothetical protein PP641_gp097 [Arthrobacter phage SilentRX]|uniref:Uncharacterized protein n=1 Tax=Arthrobacter phage SilentRX TaxID=2836091 RepID=A0A8F3IPN5_9CAUD|nr:hypothetical protein PP641_gp097 [Arthrobacter phage SilentRX]QWY82837.1 hypothetical protein SEA_SILENTRX_97 [Arthrobacter phage SilentRX]
MSASLHLVPPYTPVTAPRWKVRAEREADRRHRALVLLEELHRDTPWYCFRARRALHRAIVRHIGTGW